MREVLTNPEKVETVRAGRVVAQGKIAREGMGVYLLRIFVDVHEAPPAVVTAYFTSKIAKYGARP